MSLKHEAIFIDFIQGIHYEIRYLSQFAKLIPYTYNYRNTKYLKYFDTVEFENWYAEPDDPFYIPGLGRITKRI